MPLCLKGNKKKIAFFTSMFIGGLCLRFGGVCQVLAVFTVWGLYNGILKSQIVIFLKYYIDLYTFCQWVGAGFVV